MTTQPSELDDMITTPYVAPSQEANFFGQVVTIDRSDWRWDDRKLVSFDQTYDSPESRVRGIQIVIECEKREGGKFNIDTGSRPLLESDASWHQHTLKSISKLGVPLSQLRGMFVQVKRVDTKKTYVNKDGETKPRQALEFVATYPDWHAMHAARTQLFKRGDDTASTAPTQPVRNVPQPIPAIDKSALEKLLPALWQASGQNRDTFTLMFNANATLREAMSLDEAIDAASLPF